EGFAVGPVPVSVGRGLVPTDPDRDPPTVPEGGIRRHPAVLRVVVDADQTRAAHLTFAPRGRPVDEAITEEVRVPAEHHRGAADHPAVGAAHGPRRPAGPCRAAPGP